MSEERESTVEVKVDRLQEELTAFRTEMATGFTAVRAEMATGFTAVRTEMAAEFRGVRGEIQELRHDMQLMFEDIRSDIKALPDHRAYIDDQMAKGLASIREEFEPRLRNVELAIGKRPRRR